LTTEKSEETLNQKIAHSMVKMAEIIKKTADKIGEGSELKEMINSIMKVYKTQNRVFTMGAGRSGLVGQAFAMRLVHLGFNAHVIGDATTPAVTSEDIILVISGSGTTATNLTLCQIVLERIKPSPKIIAITSNCSSTLGRLADITIEIPGREETEITTNYAERRLVAGPPLAPLGTRFEINALVFLDSIISVLMDLTKTNETEMARRHAIE